jgi:hypothetical protein
MLEDAMPWAEQLVTVLAVLAGAGGTYVVGRLSDRDRYARELRLRWDQRRLDAYVAYVTAAKMVGATALAILDQHTSGAQKEVFAARIDQLAAMETRRNEAFEALPLISDGPTIEAGHALNHAVWKLEQPARRGRTLDEEERLALADEWVVALNKLPRRRTREHQRGRIFHEAGRRGTSRFAPRTRGDCGARRVAPGQARRSAAKRQRTPQNPLTRGVFGEPTASRQRSERMSGPLTDRRRHW